MEYQSKIINMTLIDRQVEEGWIKEYRHPTFDGYYIYNYSKKAQYENRWNDETMLCRGLIVKRDMVYKEYGFGLTDEAIIIARPFKKFFNIEECISYDIELPDEKPIIYEKMDGLLGMLYFGPNDCPYISTRGKFDSDGSRVATEMLRQIMEERDMASVDLPRETTFLFEIIHPDHRIIVDYGKDERLVLIGEVDNITGRINNSTIHCFDTVKEYDIIDNLQPDDNREGFVYYYPKADFRVKIKTNRYKKLSGLMQGASEKKILQNLAEGTPVSAELARWNLVGEFYEKVLEQEAELLNCFEVLKSCYNKIYAAAIMLHGSKDRKILALHFNQYDHPAILFNLLDNKDYEKAAWHAVIQEAL